MSSAPASSNKSALAVPSEDVLSAKASTLLGSFSPSYNGAITYITFVIIALSQIARMSIHDSTVTTATTRPSPTSLSHGCAIYRRSGPYRLAQSRPKTQSDLCVSNAIVKAGIGFGAGVVASAILFRRRPWPVLVGLGFGLGQGYSDCERVFNPVAVPGFVIAKDAKPQPSPYATFNPFGSKASDVKDKSEAKASQVVDKIKDATKQVVGKVEEVKDKAENKLGDKKWV
ncbi:BQ2448_7410 [Microbotryum intermedium]|uniref:MICOS complex subunit MIC10 n=1 Tax=Microbotryum intermedium TaxID=269621 RepID=A0A238FNN2_9BASI|nr:BQ2448_7410 [Microbotryum intermedium]